MKVSKYLLEIISSHGAKQIGIIMDWLFLSIWHKIKLGILGLLITYQGLKKNKTNCKTILEWIHNKKHKKTVGLFRESTSACFSPGFLQCPPFHVRFFCFKAGCTDISERVSKTNKGLLPKSVRGLVVESLRPVSAISGTASPFRMILGFTLTFFFPK